MTALTGTITDLGSDTANMRLVDLIATSLQTEGWTILRNVNTVGQDREVILQSTGVSTTEDIYIGFRSYQNASSDFYNISYSYFTGYVAANTFVTQPGYNEKGMCAHNTSIDYWFSYDLNSIKMALKVGTPVYEVGFLGRFLPYASPSQYPYPVAVFGTFNGQASIRFSSTHSWAFNGGSSAGNIRILTGDITPDTWPYNASLITNAVGRTNDERILRETESSYSILPIIVVDDDNVYGELDGMFFISGFNNQVENTMTIDSVNYVVMQNVNRTGFTDYIAMRLN